MSLPSSIRFLSVALIAFFVASCWDDESTPTGPAPAPVDTTRRDTSKIDTSKRDTAKKDTTKVDTSKTIVGPASSDSLAPGQKSKDIQLGGVVGSGKSVTWVKFQGTSGHTYTFTALPRVKATLQVFLLNGKDTLAQVANPLVGDSVVFPCLRGGIHLIRLIGPAGEKLELKVGENSLIPMYFEGADSYEPDNDTARAFLWDMKSSSSQRRTTHFAGAVDIDMIRLSLDSGTTLTVTANGTSILPRLGRPNATLLATDGSVLAWSENPEGTWTHASFQSRTAYLKLRGSESTDPYTVSVKSTAGLPATALLPDSLESDGALGQGPLLNPDSTIVARNFHGYVNSEDVDRFRLIADSGMVYHFTVESKSNPELAVATKDGIRQAVHDSSVVQANARSWSFLCQKTGEYSVVVKAPEAVPYRIVCVGRKGKPSWVTQPDSFELDDTRDRAVVLGQERRQVKRQLVQGDVDWHSVQVQAGQVWVVSIQFGNGNAYPEIYDADSVLVGTFPSGFSEHVWSRRFEKAGTYYLRMVGPSQRWGSPIEYTLSSQVGTSIGDAREPDDSAQAAVSAVPDGSWSNRLVHLADEDWSLVRVPAGSQLRMWLSIDEPGFSVSLQARDPSEPKSTLGPNLWVGPESHLVDSGAVFCPRDSTILLRVSGESGDTRLDHRYRVRLLLVKADTDSLEPDDGLAKRVPIDSTWLGREIHADDLDQMSVQIPANHVCTFLEEGLTTGAWKESGGYEIQLLAPQGVMLPWTWAGGRKSLLVRDQGEYLVRITGESHLKASIAYRIAVSCLPSQDSLEPDESIDVAVTIPYDSVSRRRSIAPGDQDWMRFPPSPGKERFLEMERSLASGNIIAWTLQKGGSSVSLNSQTCTPNPSGTTSCRIRIGSLEDTSTYFLKTVNWSNLSADWSPYRVRAWTVSDPDPYEASDSPLAAPLLTSQPIVRWISKGDTDLFRLHLDAGQALRPVVTGNVRWSLLTKEGKWASQDLVRGVLVQSDSAVDYLVRVNPTKDSAVFQAYSMAVVSMPYDSSARHARRATALAVASPDGVLRPALTSYADTTWFRVHMDSGRTVLFQAKSKGRIVLHTRDSVRIRDSLGSMSFYYRSTKDTCFYVGFPPRTDSVGLWPISLRVSNDFLDAFEPDDSPATAALIDSGAWQERILMVGDTDFIQLPPAPDSSTWSVELRFSEITIGTEVTRADGRGTGHNNFLSPGQSWTVISNGTGPFYLRFVGMNYGSNLPWIGGTNYRIRVIRK